MTTIDAGPITDAPERDTEAAAAVGAASTRHPAAVAAGERDRFGFGTLVAVFAVASVLAGSLGAGIGANIARNDGGSVNAGAAPPSSVASPNPPAANAAAGGTTSTTAATEHNHGGNADEQAENQPDKVLDPATQKLLSQQLIDARAAAARYPTVKDAKAAGLVLAGGMAPGVGAHYQKMSADTLKGINPDGTVNPSLPGSYIYGGVSDDSPLVGLMYLSFAVDTAPEGFAGPNDHWHRHRNVCVVYSAGKIEVPFAADSDVTKEMCDGAHGRFMQQTVWMVHAWVVPGYESPKGVFSHDNPNIHCVDGTDQVDAAGLCKTQ